MHHVFFSFKSSLCPIFPECLRKSAVFPGICKTPIRKPLITNWLPEPFVSEVQLASSVSFCQDVGMGAPNLKERPSVLIQLSLLSSFNKWDV